MMSVEKTILSLLMITGAGQVTASLGSKDDTLGQETGHAWGVSYQVSV